MRRQRLRGPGGSSVDPECDSARDARRPDEFALLGTTFKGLTDELLTFQTRELLARETRRDQHVVYVRPELVVETALDGNGIQESPRYPGRYGAPLRGGEALPR